MGNPLTDRVSLRELAKRGQVIDINDDIAALGRFVGIVEDEFKALEPVEIPQNWRQLPVSIKLRFHWADTRRQYPAAEGEVSVTAPLVCQRCLRPFEYSLVVPLRLLFAGADAGAVSESEYEVWELEEDLVRPLDIVEEALVMALPLAAVHDSSVDCMAPSQAEQEDRTENVRPFADLRSQMQDGE